MKNVINVLLSMSISIVILASPSIRAEGAGQKLTSLSSGGVISAIGVDALDSSVEKDTASVSVTRHKDSSPGSPIVLVVDDALMEAGSNFKRAGGIRLKWQATESAVVVVSSLKIFYKKGILKLNMTERFLAALAAFKHGRIDPNGVYIPNTDLPPGKHRMLIEISDSKERKTLANLTVFIADAS